MIHNQAQQPLPSVAFSSRRRRATRRGPATGQSSLPDWVWGAGLGLVVLIFVGGYFAVDAATGGGGARCDEPLVQLGTSDISEAGFAEEDEGLNQMISLLQSGDVVGFETAFFRGPLHNFAHNADKPIREKDEELAKSLCNEVMDIEEGVALRQPSDEMLASLIRIQTILRDAAEALGYPRPGDTA